MDVIKKAGIMTGAVIGGTIGGTVSVVGKVSKINVIDEVGTSIIQSSIFTGSIAGEAVSGAADMLAGKISGNNEILEEGWQDLKGSGKQVVSNFITNTKYVLKNSAHVAHGIKDKDVSKTIQGVKDLAKLVAVGAITVGAIKISESGQQSNEDEIYK